MLQPFIGAVAAVVVSVAHVRLEHAAAVVAAEIVVGTLDCAADGRLIGEIFAVRSAWKKEKVNSVQY